jgi:hypothetical protein
MNKKLASTILFFCLIFGVSKTVSGQTSLLDDSKLLQGFDTLQILIEGLPKTLTDKGLSESQIENDIEIKLRQAKFKIAENTTPFIYVTVNAVDTDGLVAYAINVSLQQSVVLQRDKLVWTIAPTWKKENIGIVGRNRINSIREKIKDFVDEFILDYLKANDPSSASKDEKFDEDAFVKSFVKDHPSKKTDSPFTATYVGGDRPPEIEVFNDTDRTLYLDLGQALMTPYTIFSKQSKTIQLVDGNYNYKATAPRVTPLQGKEDFKKGYRYTWRFKIITVKK